MKDSVSRSSAVIRAGRGRRAVSPMTSDEIKEIVDRHNFLRAAEQADNMELMVCAGRRQVKQSGVDSMGGVWGG